MTLAEQAFALHRETGIAILRCQQALREVGGDRDEAVAILLKRYSHVDPATLPGFWDQFKAMPRDNQNNPDPNANAARILRETIADEDKLPADVEAAWRSWYSHIQAVDERGMTLLKAAFEAGWKAGKTRK